jgi:stearoyl-CoA desaturase (delta-9 desaturase)
MTNVPSSLGLQYSEPGWLLRFRIFERHVGVAFALLFAPLNESLTLLLGLSYFLRVFALEGIYHRYFSHRSYRMGRATQFLFGLWGAQSGQRGPLWWASTHYKHHRNADMVGDPHSPLTRSFWYAHLGWFIDPRNGVTNLDAIPDLARFAELRWLNRWYLIPFYGAAVLLGGAGHFGWLGPHIDALSAVLWGFYVPSFLQIHAIACVNTLGHMPEAIGGSRRYGTPDQSVNRPLLALLTLGAGWHNNHHRYPPAARAGFAWYEIDLTYYVLRLFQALHVVRDVKGRVPPEVLREGNLVSTPMRG